MDIDQLADQVSNFKSEVENYQYKKEEVDNDRKNTERKYREKMAEIIRGMQDVIFDLKKEREELDEKIKEIENLKK